ncbi:hypothetical protein C8R32_101164 [Nitrosospira sp. Nsp5]|uniref:Uncharacterized protein n=1 Tax=Nitrosospira multiformis TaxID=1231 RepID=A0ABY0TLF7_9PROT|nr:hypothetical protein C8R32_101164 [Nitrosospira sp. Nsp5]SDQ79099.1 hypothetical protein SAMN05216402_2298 [Nitrosospira multiformis]
MSFVVMAVRDAVHADLPTHRIITATICAGKLMRGTAGLS